MKQTRRVLVETGIYRERNRFYVVARIGSRRTEELTESTYFELDAELEDMRAWRHEALARLWASRKTVTRRGTLAGDVAPFLNTVEAGSRREDYRACLAHWAASPLGELPRRQITREQIMTLRSRWLELDVAASTVNHRVRALRALYEGLDGGPQKAHPTDKIRRIKGPELEPRGIPMPYVDLVLAEIPDRGRAEKGKRAPAVSEHKTRLTIIANTGLAHASLKRLRERDVELDATPPRYYLAPRRKGQSSNKRVGKWLQLTPQAADAFRQFDALGLWGQPWSRSSMHKMWTKAIARVARRLEKAGDRAALKRFRDAIPEKCRPYDLRHSFLTEVYRVTGDRGAVAELAGHSTLELGARYTSGAVAERVTVAIDKMTEVRRAARRARLELVEGARA